MSLTRQQDLFILEHLAAGAENIAECGKVLPAPLEYVDKADFFASVGETSLDTQKEIETTEVAMTVLTMPKAPVRPANHGGVWTYSYNFYVFREYNRERADESEMPDEFRKKLLKSYQNFRYAIFGICAEFGEEYEITGLPDGIAAALAQIDQETDFIEENEPCRYLQVVSGYGVDLPITVRIRFKDC